MIIGRVLLDLLATIPSSLYIYSVNVFLFRALLRSIKGNILKILISTGGAEIKACLINFSPTCFFIVRCTRGAIYVGAGAAE